MFSISEASAALGVTPHTLRYYEKEGIITPERSESGVRIYTDSHIKWLKFVMKLRETQMPISSIKRYTELVLEGTHTTRERLSLLEVHQINIQEQIHTLLSTNDMLNDKIGSYKKRLADGNPSI
ncbi:MerR family transcriptional regulator [Bacillus sp. AFS015802]|uniref:MerR family transcriptional regulator n=1 Tax=Bacillus sp. AFS015802 TaxID=2033486 RepID=UPI000BFA9392|nr:MerR family transcriptional regulator [Bacillus sp. AFS015802]PFA67121.1 MerR family transcriptional regulator [Bacillus sp. AFS015802]